MTFTTLGSLFAGRSLSGSSNEFLENGGVTPTGRGGGRVATGSATGAGGGGGGVGAARPDLALTGARLVSRTVGAEEVAARTGVASWDGARVPGVDGATATGPGAGAAALAARAVGAAAEPSGAAATAGGWAGGRAGGAGSVAEGSGEIAPVVAPAGSSGSSVRGCPAVPCGAVRPLRAAITPTTTSPAISPAAANQIGRRIQGDAARGWVVAAPGTPELDWTSGSARVAMVGGRIDRGVGENPAGLPPPSSVVRWAAQASRTSRASAPSSDASRLAAPGSAAAIRRSTSEAVFGRPAGSCWRV